MPRKSNFIQIGGQRLTAVDQLNEKVMYHYLPLTGEALTKALTDLKAFPEEAVYNSTTAFLFGDDTLDEFSLEEVRLLPSDQIFYEVMNNTDPERQHMLRLKRALQVDLSDGGGALVQYLNNNLYTSPGGFTLNNSATQLSTDFKGKITRKGTARFIFEGAFGEDYERLILWKIGGRPDNLVTFHAEIGTTDGQVDYFYRIYYENQDGFQTRDFDEADLLTGYVNQNFGALRSDVTIALFAKGAGRLVVGEIHLRNGYLSKQNFLSVGGSRLVDDNNFHEELGYYFNAADLKPPLNVYFSGWRPKESYEGRWMMGGLGSPFILVFDPRIIGGSFYRGGTLEKQLVDMIHEKLDELGFTTDQLNLSGLSMGTYASFYYSTMLKPHSLVVGKPLAGIGN